MTEDCTHEGIKIYFVNSLGYIMLTETEKYNEVPVWKNIFRIITTTDEQRGVIQNAFAPISPFDFDMEIKKPDTCHILFEVSSVPDDLISFYKDFLNRLNAHRSGIVIPESSNIITLN